MKILSPAGSYDAMVAAVKTGADAVYLGLDSFNARAGAENFTEDTLKDAVFYCHKRGVEVFVTLNTLVYDNEIAKITKVIDVIYNSLADGVIVQDLGVAKLVQKIAPDLRLVASTQMTTNNLAGVKLLEKEGFDTVVLPRELSRREIEKIRKATDLNLEVFAHGALCVCYSGQCLMSSFIGERSGNRGKCAQPCRMMYECRSKKGAFLSPKDLALVDYLPDLEEAGADVIKLEGRLKSKYYTAAVTDVYRRVLDSEEAPTEEDYAILNASFNRGGYTPGYFDGIKDKHLFNYYKNENPYSRETKKMERYYDQILNKDREFSQIPISVSLALEANKPVEVEILLDEDVYPFTSETVPQLAQNAPITREKLMDQLSKTGNETFCFEEIEIAMSDEPLFLSVSQMNGLRREIGAYLDSLFQFERHIEPYSYQMKKRKTTDELDYYCTVSTAFQMKWVRELWDKKIFAKKEVIEEYWEKYGEIDNIGLWCERIATDKQISASRSFLSAHPEITDILVGNIGYLKAFAPNYNIYADYSLNITNTLSAEFLEQKGVKSITASVEANLKNVKNIITEDADLCILGYGQIPLMITQSCIKSNLRGKCDKSDLTITDRKGEEFVIACENCSQNAIYNPYPIMMSDKLNDIRAAGVNCVRLHFFRENKAQVQEIIHSFKLEQNPLTRYTRGHYYRGAY
ncbi:MAG: U32 family peptidase [Clostridia bacterium]|nr:U32 family peptidase [Clostridia bacterium]